MAGSLARVLASVWRVLGYCFARMNFSKIARIARNVLCGGSVLLTMLSSRAADTLPPIDLKPAFPNLKFNRPLWMEEIPDGSKRVVVIEQSGKVQVFPKQAGVTQTKMFIDLSPRKPLVQNEEGLLAFAFNTKPMADFTFITRNKARNAKS
jgi:hypothetical protein